MSEEKAKQVARAMFAQHKAYYMYRFQVYGAFCNCNTDTICPYVAVDKFRRIYVDEIVRQCVAETIVDEPCSSQEDVYAPLTSTDIRIINHIARYYPFEVHDKREIGRLISIIQVVHDYHESFRELAPTVETAYIRAYMTFARLSHKDSTPMELTEPIGIGA